MSRGGKGGQSVSGVRAIANALGLQRHEIGAYTQTKKEPPPLFPPLSRHVRELPASRELSYMTALKEELLERFHESAVYQPKRASKDVYRYTDKYRKVRKEAFEPIFSRVPAELNWESTSTVRTVKKRKLDDKIVAEKLAKLEEKEKVVVEHEEEPKEEEEEEEDFEKKDDDEDSISDDDYLEEENDYVNNYFDNGEGDASDDNLDENDAY
ncbi:unnamed protein product [Bursaphelenchus okinawaensis]|uniref:DNA-directed RNA polymerase III subunit n=1 Tax=Bursaphelenchus okinawaensis TaxID=465554 RepID=A0A811JRD9_9BILA|nr:unnamed protein product [Bursaphelenchus okinawaensis]CAG9079010.1 unnamed protein product [Bursaphelenchus okinawaensis]